METLQIEQQGFPLQFTYPDFIRQFSSLLPQNDGVQAKEKELERGKGRGIESVEKVNEIMRAIKFPESAYKLGLSKVFLHSSFVPHVEVCSYYILWCKQTLNNSFIRDHAEGHLIGLKF